MAFKSSTLECWFCHLGLTTSYSPFSNAFTFYFLQNLIPLLNCILQPPKSLYWRLYFYLLQQLVGLSYLPYNTPEYFTIESTHRTASHSTLHYIGTLFVVGYGKLRKWVNKMWNTATLRNFWNTVAQSNQWLYHDLQARTTYYYL